MSSLKQLKGAIKHSWSDMLPGLWYDLEYHVPWHNSCAVAVGHP